MFRDIPLHDCTCLQEEKEPVLVLHFKTRDVQMSCKALAHHACHESIEFKLDILRIRREDTEPVDLLDTSSHDRASRITHGTLHLDDATAEGSISLCLRLCLLQLLSVHHTACLQPCLVDFECIM
jgi:hypothetical protein